LVFGMEWWQRPRGLLLLLRTSFSCISATYGGWHGIRHPPVKRSFGSRVAGTRAPFDVWAEFWHRRQQPGPIVAMEPIAIVTADSGGIASYSVRTWRFVYGFVHGLNARIVTVMGQLRLPVIESAKLFKMFISSFFDAFAPLQRCSCFSRPGPIRSKDAEPQLRQ
jgi:hypothetical protein